MIYYFFLLEYLKKDFSKVQNHKFRLKGAPYPKMDQKVCLNLEIRSIECYCWGLPPRFKPPTHSHEILISSTLLITEKDLFPHKITKSHSISPRVLLSLLSLSIIGLSFN